MLGNCLNIAISATNYKKKSEFTITSQPILVHYPKSYRLDSSSLFRCTHHAI